MGTLSLASISFSVALIFLTICSSGADQNIYKKRQPLFPSIVASAATTDSAELQEICEDDVCDRMKLIIYRNARIGNVVQVIGTHEVNLTKRFELLLQNEFGVCSHYIGSDPKLFAAIRFCAAHHQSGEKRYEGTFFDEFNARYDLMILPGKAYARDAYTITRVRASGIGKMIGESHDKSWSRQRAALPSDNAGTQWPPVLGRFKRPTIELLVGVDDNFTAYFNHSEEAIIKFVSMSVISTDAMYHWMGIDVRLVGVRFWKKYGLSSMPKRILGALAPQKERSFEDYWEQVFTFVTKNMTARNNESGAGQITGVPDAVVTLTQVTPSDGMLGLARVRDPVTGAHSLVKAVRDSFLTTNLSQPHRLHHYACSVTLAHEMGHNLFLEHSPTTSKCYTDNGECIMSDTVRWSLPFWLEDERDSIHQNLQSTHQFLMEQNVKHNTIGSERQRAKRMTRSSGITLYCLFAVSVGCCILSGAAFWIWRKKQSPERTPLLQHEYQRKDI